MREEIKWSDEVSETDFTLWPRDDAFLLLLESEPPRNGKCRWSLEASDLYAKTRWDLVEAEGATYVVRDREVDDFTRFTERSVSFWPAPADLAEYPEHLAGASLRCVQRHLLDGVVAPQTLFSHTVDIEEERDPEFRPVRFDEVPERFRGLLAHAKRAVVQRLDGQPEDVDELPAGCARRHVVYHDASGVDVMADDAWRVSFSLRTGSRSGWIVLQWWGGDTVHAQNQNDVIGWFVGSEPEKAILQKSPCGLPMGLVVRTVLLQPGQTV